MRGKQPRFFYATQAQSEPPTFVLFASEAQQIHFSYRRYLENRLREAFGFAGTPLRIVIRQRERDDTDRPRGRGRGRSRGTKSKARR